MKLIIFVIFIGIVFAVLKSLKKDNQENNNDLKIVEKDIYKANQLMTKNELEFFNRLVKAFPELYVFPQVSFSALISPNTNDFRKASSIKNTYNRYRTDFILFKEDKVIAVIELDDKTHKNKEDKDAKRDSMLKEAGYSVYRFESNNKPNIETLKNTIKI